MAARTKTAAARARAGGRGDEETEGGFRLGEWRILVCEAIGTGAVVGAGIVLGLLVIGLLQ